MAGGWGKTHGNLLTCIISNCTILRNKGEKVFAQQSSRCSECSGCVLSPSTEAIDKIKKLAYYQECPAIQDYIVSPDSLLTAVCFSSFVIARDMSLFSAVSGCTVAKSFRKAGKILTVAFPNDGLLDPPM